MVPRNFHNSQKLKSSRRRLRDALTPAEASLWRILRQSKLQGRKFRRQHSVGPYIVDFYCATEKMVVELDGAAHDSEQRFKHDEQRTRFLESLDLRVVRIENRDVFNNPDGVLAQIASLFGGKS